MTISIVSIFWNESKYLKEWIEFHLLIGVDKFYLVNNNSTDNYLDVLSGYINSGVVVLSNITTNIHNNDPSRSNEVSLVNDWVKELNRIALTCNEDWVIHVSTDEFIYPVNENNLKDVLKTTPNNVGEISVNWSMFGNNNIELKDDELLIDKIRIGSYDNNISNLHVKPIMRQKAIQYIPSVHFSSLKKGFIKTDTKYDVNNFKHPYATKKWIGDQILVNHYRYRDLSYTKEKVKMYRLWGRDITVESVSKQYNDVYNERIVKYIPELKKRLRI